MRLGSTGGVRRRDADVALRERPSRVKAVLFDFNRQDCNLDHLPSRPAQSSRPIMGIARLRVNHVQRPDGAVMGSAGRMSAERRRPY